MSARNPTTWKARDEFIKVVLASKIAPPELVAVGNSSRRAAS